MGIPAGLGATFGVAAETTVGTAAVTSRWLVIDNESFKFKKTIAQSKGLRGALYELGARRRLVEKSADGKVTLDLVDKGMGLLLKMMLGSSATATVQGATAAYLQTHTPGPLVGLSLTVQKGIPDTGGTVHALTYVGTKVDDWEIMVKQKELVKLSLTLDAWNEDTSVSYAAASYVAANPFDFTQGALLLGGTATTTTGVTSVAAGAAPLGVVKAVTIKGKNPLKNDRFTLGSATKREQLDNNFREISGDIEIEFASYADAYTAMQADTGTVVQLNFTGALIGGGNYAFLNIILPKVFLEEAPLEAAGTDVITVKVPFKALDDGTNPAIQIQYQSTDIAI